jgi:hypothetical protein
VATRYEELVFGCLVAGIADSNPTEGMDICLMCLYVVLYCVGRSLCDKLITLPEESYHVSVCVIKKPQYRGGQVSSIVCSARGGKTLIR